MSNRFAPSIQVLVKGTDVSDYLTASSGGEGFHGYLYCTNRVGNFDLSLSNPQQIWSGAFAYADPVIVKVQGSTVFKSRIDETDDDVDKIQADDIKYSGRDDGGALQDIITSKQYAFQDINGIITDILNTYNSSRLSKDPAITVGNILPAAGTLNMSFLFKRYDLWKMLQEVATQLAAPVSLGGLGMFFDFYVTSADKFYFEPIGTRPSATYPGPFGNSPVNLGSIGGIEIKKRSYVIDSLPIKNDLWIIGPQNLGTIPLSMQLGYLSYSNPSLVADPWTENNATDYVGTMPNPPYTTTEIATAADGSGMGLLSNVTSPVLVGTYSIRAQFFKSAQSLVANRGAWVMPFPFGTKWPGQAPGGHLNAYNEISPLSETMGEMSYFSYFLQSTFNTNHWLEVADQGGTGNVKKSPSFAIPGNSTWTQIPMPFGPSADNQYTLIYSGGNAFDWSNIPQVNFVFDLTSVNAIIGAGAYGYVYFDGFRIVKPLIVNANENAIYGAGTSTTNRTNTVNASNLLSYTQAKIYAQSLLQNQRKPYQYYDIRRIGNVDNFLPGYLIQSENKSLLLREVEYLISKEQGWTIQSKAWEKT